MSGLGRRIPTDWDHVTKYPMRAAIPHTVATVEQILDMKDWREFYDQGQEGACVGFGCSWMMSILNSHQNGLTRKYDARWLYVHAQDVDEWTDTPPEEGTSVRAACDILRTQGHCLVVKRHPQACDLTQGIAANRWATTADEMRTAISLGIPVAIGVNWYTAFDKPQKREKGEWWAGRDVGGLGAVRGGHCVCVYGASDKRSAFCFVNNWGKSYPLRTWMPYVVMQRLLTEGGEAALVTDR